MTSYFKQETQWTCGPACMRMVLSRVKVQKSEKALVKLLKTTHRHGTNHNEFPKLAKKFKLFHIVGKQDSTIADLRSALNEGLQIIVCYFSLEDNFGHYAVINKITKTYIYLSDPEKGPNFKLSLKEFSKTWHGTHTYQGWFFGVKKV